MNPDTGPVAAGPAALALPLALAAELAAPVTAAASGARPSEVRSGTGRGRRAARRRAAAVRG
ncbi:hypothetical protein AB0H45_04690 [Streptomyces atroolivaceus]|uniref:Uncharacterized protein n=1 Tax=Streptomyces atroolivaceus TaxID=66869 RepID=A0ABV9V3P3_STRAZ|nr:hypothetical protein [Streptomyces atroolivaceus]